MSKWNFQLWLALNGAQHINTLFCKPINQSKLRWRRVRKLLGVEKRSVNQYAQILSRWLLEEK